MTNAVLARLRALVTGTAISECELCAQSIAVEHEHLLEPDARRVFCSCSACAALFVQEQERRGARYLRVERRAARIVDVDFDDGTWADLGVPVGLAFFTTRTRTSEVVATFPGRSGIIESFVPLRIWGELEQRFPLLRGILPDVEALLVRRSPRHADYFQVSIDHCYELAGLLRSVQTPSAPAELPQVQTFFAGLEQSLGQRRHSKRPSV